MVNFSLANQQTILQPATDPAACYPGSIKGKNYQQRVESGKYRDGPGIFRKIHGRIVCKIKIFCSQEIYHLSFRNSSFIIFPEAFFGKLSRTITARGALYSGRRDLQNAINSSGMTSTPIFGTTKAQIASPIY